MEINRKNILKAGDYKGLSLAGTHKGDALSMYRFMTRLRRLQEEIVKEYHPANEMRCPVHFCIGQEAVPAALSQLVRPDDILFGSHRAHGYFLAKSGSMKALLAELYGRETGTNGGKAGSQEICSSDINFYSGAILTGLPGMAVGAALSFKLKKERRIAVACFGDGAVDEGIFWETVNYAQLCRLPVVFVCENNGYSTYSPQLNRQTSDDIHKRVAAFGLRSEALFGNDVVKVKAALAEAFDRARAGKGPSFIETYTYRWLGHVGPEDDDYVCYRAPKEIAFWKRNCPIALLGEKMEAKKYLTAEAKAGMLAEINAEIAEAFKFAKASPFPSDTDWEGQNYSACSPLADRLLKDHTLTGAFDHSQEETKPEPY